MLKKSGKKYLDGVQFICKDRATNERGSLMKTFPITVGQALVKFLNQQYVEFDGQEQPFVEGIFTIFGHGIVLGLGEALDADPGHLKVYQGRNEQGMAHAAIGYAKQKNRRSIIACSSSIGPGATNMVTAALTATVNNIPLLLLPADVFATRQPDPVLQQLEQGHDLSLTANDCFRPVCRYWDRVSRPEQLMTAMINAMRVLTNPATAGAVCVALPQDVQGEIYDFPEYFFRKRVHHIARTKPETYELNNVKEALLRSKKPLIIAGGGVRYSEAGEALMKFCREFNIPVAQTQAGHSCLPDSFELACGGIGVTGGLAANILAKDADFILGIGTRFSDFTTGSKWIIFRNPIMRIATINVSDYHAEKLDAIRCVADAKEAITELHLELRAAGYKSSYTDEISKANAAWSAEMNRVNTMEYGTPSFSPLISCGNPEKQIADFIRVTGGGLSQCNALHILRQESAPNAIVVAAAGSLPGDLERLWLTDTKDSYSMEYGTSCMGHEINGALGVALAEPEREVYAMTGDGSFFMLNSEISTMRQERRKVIIMVFDNAAFGCINNLQTGNGVNSLATEMRYRNSETGLLDGDYVYTDFAKIGEGYGLNSYSARTPDELRAAVRAARKADGPCLIDVKVLPKTMTDGYEGWWHCGLAQTSTNEKVNEARLKMDRHLAEARKY